MLSRLVITFFSRSKCLLFYLVFCCKCLLISWLQSSSAVILELKKIKFDTVSIDSLEVHKEKTEERMTRMMLNLKE